MFSSTLEKKKKKIRSKIKVQQKYRLTVYKSNKHTYAQVYEYDGSIVITSMSTLDNIFKCEIKKLEKKLNKTEKANLVGHLLAQKIKEKNINNVAFDRSGFKFHGRVKAIADSIKACGIKC